MKKTLMLGILGWSLLAENHGTTVSQSAGGPMDPQNSSVTIDMTSGDYPDGSNPAHLTVTCYQEGTKKNLRVSATLKGPLQPGFWQTHYSATSSPSDLRMYQIRTQLGGNKPTKRMWTLENDDVTFLYGSTFWYANRNVASKGLVKEMLAAPGMRLQFTPYGSQMSWTVTFIFDRFAAEFAKHPECSI